MPDPCSAAELLDVRASELGSRIAFAFVDSGDAWSYGDLPRRAARVARQLTDAGVEHGMRVAILADNRAAFCDAFLGAEFLGAIPVPIGVAGNPGTKAWSAVLRDRVERFGARVIATDAASHDVLGQLIGCDRVVSVDGSDGPQLASATPHDIALIQPSSGTTGEPKGIVISQRALLANLAAMREHWEFDASDVGLSWLPLFHDMGLIGTTINAVFAKVTLYHWPTASFLRSPGRWVELLDELGVTLTAVPPFALDLVTRRLKRRGSSADLSKVRHLLVGAERIRAEVLEEFQEVFAPAGLSPTALSPTYGLAEATLAVSAKPLGEKFHAVDDGLHRWTSCGRPVPGVDLAVDDVTGEILVDTPGLMDGYLDDPDGTAAATPGGLLRTGDCGRLVDGELIVQGRLKEMINRGGVRVAASDFELAIHGVDGVLSDRAVAFGDLGTDGERVVVLAESRRRDDGRIVLALRARLADVGLAADVVELVAPGFIPRTTSGKLRRAAARDRWQAQDASADSN